MERGLQRKPSHLELDLKDLGINKIWSGHALGVYGAQFPKTCLRQYCVPPICQVNEEVRDPMKDAKLYMMHYV